MLAHHSSSSASSSSPTGYDSYSADAPLLLAVALPSTPATSTATTTTSLSGTVRDEEWEDLCRESGGWEFIDGTEAPGGNKDVGKGIRNEYGGMWTIFNPIHLGGAGAGGRKSIVRIQVEKREKRLMSAIPKRCRNHRTRTPEGSTRGE